MSLLRRLRDVYAREGLIGLRRRLITRLAGAEPVAPRVIEPILLNLDHPDLDQSLSDRIWIGGWAVSRSGVTRVQVGLDDAPQGAAHLGIGRPDLAKLYPEFEGAWQSGFTFPLDTNKYRDGQHELSLIVTSGEGRREAFLFALEIDNRQSDYQRWLAAHAEDPAPTEDDGIAFLITQGDNIPMPATDGAATNYLMALDPSDRLAPQALARLAAAAREQDFPDLIYGDEDLIEADGQRHSPAFKPGWSPTLLEAVNYIGRPWALRADRLESLGLAWPPDDDHAFLQRLAESKPRVAHVADVLCSRAERAPRPNAPSTRPRPPSRPKVSAVVPTKAGSDLIRNCLTSLAEKTAYDDLELILLANPAPGDQAAEAFLANFPAKKIEMTGPFNWSAYNTQGAAAASGEVLVFANDDLEPIAEDWVEALLEHAVKPTVGPVGAKLLYGDERVQHCGMFLVEEGGGNRHAFRFLERDDPGYLGLAALPREVIAVTGACLMVERQKFERLEGFDEALALTHNDLDFCLRAREAGLSSVVTPHALLYHHERVTRRMMPEDADTALFRERWRTLYEAGDPYYNSNLAKDRDDYAIAAPKRG
ncbi:MAG: glycosyltransferase [Pseudomonadota bacterium]